MTKELEGLNSLVLQQIDDSSQIRETLSAIRGENNKIQTDFVELNQVIDTFRNENKILHNQSAVKVQSLERRIISLAALEEKLNAPASSVITQPVDLKDTVPVTGVKEQAISLLEDNPHDGSALLTLGKVFFEEGDMVSSARYLKKLVEQEPFNEEAFFLLGRVSRKEGDFSQAAYLYSRLTRLKPENPLYYNNLARAYLECRQFSDAVTAIEQSLSLDGESVGSLNLAGEIYRLNQSFSSSQLAYEKSLQLQFDPDIASSLGDLFYMNGQPEQALVQWQTAIKDYDGFSEEEDKKIKYLYGKMARVSVETGQYRQVEDFYRSVEERGGDADVFYFYLSSLLSRGKEKLFEEKLRLFEERYPDSPYDEELTAMKSAGGGV